jgi:hypothetical protein
MTGYLFRQFCFAVAMSAAMLGDTAGVCPVAIAAGPPAVDENEMPPDFEYIREKAEGGSAKAQTLLGDFYMGALDFTNAVVWYRKAAQQGDVGAQLTLASCLVTGRGAEKSPQEAAHWLREAARQIESPAPLPKPDSASRSNAPAIVVAPNVVISNAPVAVTSTNTLADSNPPLAPPPAPPAADNFARVQRVGTLQSVEPVLQETRPVPKPYSDSR